jgi:hypothetical protein
VRFFSFGICKTTSWQTDDAIHVVSFPICPGPVNTDLLNNLLQDRHIKLLPNVITRSADESAEYILARINEATRERDVFVQWDGKVIPW